MTCALAQQEELMLLGPFMGTGASENMSPMGWRATPEHPKRPYMARRGCEVFNMLAADKAQTRVMNIGNGAVDFSRICLQWRLQLKLADLSQRLY
jgi:hypothetical protein